MIELCYMTQCNGDSPYSVDVDHNCYKLYSFCNNDVLALLDPESGWTDYNVIGYY